MDLAVSHAPSATDWKDQLPLYFAGGASAAAVVSIAASQILLGLALASLIATGRKPRWLPIYPALITWCLLTIVSALHSGHALKGFPQIKKFYVYLMLVVVSTAFRKISEVRVLAFVWAPPSRRFPLRGAWSNLPASIEARSATGPTSTLLTSATGSLASWTIG